MQDNFATTVKRIQAHRAANPAHGLSSRIEDVEADLMDQVAKRILADAPEAATKWVVPIDDEAKKKSQFRRSSPVGGVPQGVPTVHLGVVDRVLNRIRGIARGAATLADWVGEGGIPVSPVVANARARICAGCPLNVPSEGFVDSVTGALADAIHRQVVIKNAIGLSTDVEDKLQTCDACGCFLRLKVWVPLNVIAERTDPETEERLVPNCWIKSERSIARVVGKKSKEEFSQVITYQRRAAFGDVILSTILATKLREVGVGTRLLTEPIIAQALRGHPHLLEIASTGPAEVALDKTYEDNIERKSKDIGRLFLEAAAHQLARHGIRIKDMVNLVPFLGLDDDEKWAALRELERLPKPWAVVVDGSGSWPNRSVSRAQIDRLPSLLPGWGLIWSKPWRWVSSPQGFEKLEVRGFRHLMALISQADLVITPDTGPIHVAAAFQKPVVAMEQCNDTALRLTNLTDWTAVAPKLDCIRCGEFICPIDAQKPPCQIIPAEEISEAAKAKLSAYSGGKVAAIIPVLNYSERLARCISNLRGQVQEIIVVLDGGGTVDPAVKRMGIKIVPSTGSRIGYGKSVMRAARLSSHPYLLLLNDDCYLGENAVKAMLDVAGPTVAAVGCQLRYPTGKIQHGGMFRPRGVAGFGHIDHGKDRASIQDPVDMEAVTFAAALVRRDALYAVRGFDEIYDCYSEDTDLCMKFIANGWRIVYQPHAKGIHEESASTSPWKEKMLGDGARIFVSKWRHFLESNKPLYQVQ